jgi:uncharacterized membrane protein YagU involved in acid resistance
MRWLNLKEVGHHRQTNNINFYYMYEFEKYNILEDLIFSFTFSCYFIISENNIN